ncbi:MAG: amino acid adenylation domain-containing protein [Polyangiaceae bacterium]|nr:amino acid adenylation domain-containing protein [Polyangiaceae bacterium]
MSEADPQPSVDCLPTLFEAQVDVDSSRVATSSKDQRLTYGALDERANRLARHLRELGVKPDVTVAICLRRSLDFVVTVLAVLKAGGAYVPIDPLNPADRTHFYLEDSRAHVLVTHRDISISTPPSTRVVLLDDHAEAILAHEATRLPLSCSPSDRAYVIYTSGSTGKPKGVEVSHANVARLFAVTQPLFGFGRTDTWTLCHSAAFDFSVWELFGALLHGGRVVVIPQEIVLEPRRLAALIASERVTMLSQTPSAFRQLAPELLNLGKPSSLRWIVFGGEALEPAMLRPWVERLGDERPELVNMYGITETTVHATYRRILAADILNGRGSPIGRALGDLEILLLDERRCPVAQGEIGEIFITGRGVARGYFGHEALTAERFITLPNGRRAYRSGDLAKVLPDGQLDFIGRADEQIKIRGYRVELGEIKCVLLDCAGVADAAVVCRRERDDAEICAYVVPKSGARFSPKRLAAEVARRLPSYMVPAAVVLLDRLPLTMNGKLDRAALPPPRREQAIYREPASRTEKAVCRLASRALELERIGLDDSFVELGGHSLQAAEAARALEAELGRRVSVIELLSGQTMAELAAKLDQEPQRPFEATARPERSACADEVPASSAGLQLWLHAQRYPEDTAYNETLTLTIPNSVDASQIERALGEVVARHSLLRTRFVWRSGALFQHIEAPASVPLDIRDLRALPPEERALEAKRLSEAQARIPFDLTRPPLVRARLVHLQDREHKLYITIHHAVCDARSLHNIAAELSEILESSAKERLPQLPVLPVGHAALLSGENGGDQLDLPASAPSARPLREAIRPLGLPLGNNVPPEGARRHVLISPALAKSLRAIGATEKATLFMVLLTAWHTLLHRYSGGDSAVVGIVVDLRTSSELLPLVGPLFAVRPIAANPRGDKTFSSLLSEVRAAVLDALRAGLQAPERAQSAGVAFETTFGMVPRPPALAGGLQARVLEIENGAAKHDLSMLLQEEADGGLSGFLEHRTALWSADFADRMAGHFLAILESVAEDAGQRLSELRMLGQEERQKLLLWGRGRADDLTEAPSLPSAHELFLAQAQKTPEAVAIEWNNGVLSYRQLARRASAIAARLRAMGIRRESLILVCLDRSPDLVATLLGILMAGGAFLPLDVAQPEQRIARVIQNAKPALIMTSLRFRSRFPRGSVPVLHIDEEHFPEPSATEDACAPVEPAQLAYVIYTSGSTGRPKGVMIEHRGLSNLIAAWARAVGAEPEGRMLQFSRISFDASIWEIFSTLAAGAVLVLPGEGGPLIGSELAAVLRRRAITTMLIPPSALLTLPNDDFPELQTLIVGGEAFPEEVVEHWSRGRRLFNAYGPTECTVYTTVTRCEPGQGKPPIGRPLENVEVYVLGPARELMPVGVPGELYIGGVGVARGYLNEPELTAARFVENPLRPEQRLYRSGDRAAWRADGQLDFLGRIDRQIKLRGFRIEPDEIEAVLREHPDIQDAVVIAREDIPGHPWLCSYITMHASDKTTELQTETNEMTHLERFLRDRLPDYMVPATIMRLDALPLTASGKIDRASLPSPHSARLRPAAADVHADALESQIAAIWAEVLGIEHIGHSESFFHAGGTSLLLARTQERLEVALGRSLPIPLLFQHPTPRALATFLRGDTKSHADDSTARAERFRRALATKPRRKREA